MKRILVVGTSGSGKSTVAQKIAARFNLPYFASDPFYWEGNWKTVPSERVREKLHKVIEQDAWVLDGNFDDEWELVWKRADCLVWLDYSLPVILGQVILRNLRWLISGETIWSGNRMTLRRMVSGIRHTIHSYPLKKERYPIQIATMQGMEVHRYKTRRETDGWLKRYLLPNTG